jgi:cobalamin biosynthesis Mg chelatase CobN
MTKSEKKAQLKKMIAEFFAATNPTVREEIRDAIVKEVNKLPMSSHDRNHTEDEMDLCLYNINRYIKDPKNTAAHTSVVADFEEIIKTVDISLLAN